MNKVLKILLGIILGVFILLLILPFLFKGKIESVVKEEINKQVNARVDYESFSLSFIKGFPNIYIGLNGLSIVGNEPFEKDTLLSFNEFSVKVDLISAISGDVEVNSVLLDKIKLNAIVLADSTANWNIMKETTEDVVDEESVESQEESFKVLLKSFKVTDASIEYVDNTMALKSRISGFNMNMSGDMSDIVTNIKVNTEISGVSVEYDGIKYLNNTQMGLDAIINANLEKMLFTLKENDLRVNKMALQLDGSVGVLDDRYAIDLSMKTKNTDFKSLLALVPEVYMKDLENLKTDGELLLTGIVKGDYIDEEHLPAFNLDLTVKEGMIQYPDLPKSIDDINVALKINNQGGGADNTISELEKFHFELGGNPFDASLLVTTPVSNLTFKGKVDGKIDLNSLEDAVPLDSVELKGLIEAHVSLDGNTALIDEDKYDEIQSNGTVKMKGFSYSDNELPYIIGISDAEMEFTPEYMELKAFESKIGDSDFSLKGKLENYLSYALSEGVLKGKLSHQSLLIDSNEFLYDSSDEVATQSEDTISLQIIEVPKNLDLVLTSEIKHLKYDKLDVTNIDGKITVRNGAVVLDGLDMNTMGGKLTMDGQYNTADMNRPFVDFAFTGKNIDINKAANSFSVVDSMMPIAKNAAGLVSPNFKYYSLLSNDFMPIMSSIDGGGNIKSDGVQVSDSKIQNGIAALVRDDRYKVMKAEDFNIKFTIDKGNVIVEPFKTKVYGKIIEIEGKQGVDQSIDYRITMPVARQEVANMAGLMGMNLPTSGDDLMVDVIVKGTVKDPQLSLNLEKAQKEVGKELEKEAGKAVKKLLEDPDAQKKVEELTKKFKSIFK
ncbi:AsmA-like C-terminal region-containing protein [Carboxylicivirga caseinilyticus]|uniref:AsmA-like C-terminal region-containing protein n=1 Tax=Carboxylicivirga caseinilyticus TaxID=3417572 RepID=UPI003D34DDE0|nr:AsmA family protein [Marinilabiliaceae bacterium A049]